MNAGEKQAFFGEGIMKAEYFNKVTSEQISKGGEEASHTDNYMKQEHYN